MKKAKPDRMGIETWSDKSIKSFRIMLKTYCPNGMDNACDGTPLERGKPWKEKCRYFCGGKCTQDNIEKSRKFAENAARRHG